MEASTSDHIAVDIAAGDHAGETKSAGDTPLVPHSSGEAPTENLLVLSAATQSSKQEQQAANETTSAKPSIPTTPNSVGSGITSLNQYPVGTDKEEEEGESVPSSHIKLGFRVAILVLEFLLAIIFLCLLIVSLFVDAWKEHTISGLHTWKWCLLIFMFLGGRFAAEVIVSCVFYFIKAGYLLCLKKPEDDNSTWSYTHKEKLAYILVGLMPSIQIFLWISSILIAWSFLLFRGEDRSHHTRKVLHYFTRAWAGSLVGAAIWLLKTLLMMLAAFEFIVEQSVQSIRDTIADQETLRKIWYNCSPVSEQEYKRKLDREERFETLSYDFMLKNQVRTWTPHKIVEAITRNPLPVIMESRRKNNTAERVARITADELFARLAGDYSAKYISTEKVLTLLNEAQKKRIPVTDEEGGVDQISRSFFRKWVVRVYIDRLLLLRSLNGRDKALRELNVIVSSIVIVIILVVWLLIMGYLSTQVMILIATQILAWNFVFNQTARTIFESIIFVFITRPFDVGDLCFIDGGDEQVVVHSMKFLSTVFRKSNGEKLVYPNSSLTGKCITNFKGIPETSDSVEFTIDAKTTPEKIQELKSRIEQYLSSRPKHWRAGRYTIVVDDVDRRDKSVGIYVEHVVNYYNGGDRKKRRKELIDEVNDIVSELHITCHSDPQ